ncbi:unnamed protein product [Toxocara canis]|uniref:BRO1 domain-containing protein n=1 Tax=Toxocara canis TaxID=6265 RepID=A0A3P7GP30_TOXCA|nr:unnamed protein product [Toxocara canis]
MMPDTLAALSATMLAQAQEAIYIKAEKDKMKPTALVKIASQCAEFYQEAQKHAHRDNLRGLFDKEWVNTVTGKSLAMSALAQYHQAMVNADAKEIGEQLSRLTEAQSLMNQANSYLPSSTFATQTALIQKAYTAAKKDNDFIYHERVADFRSLPALPKAALAKPLPVNFPMTPRFKDMFSSLVPVQVHSALASYDARKAELINMETGRLREYTQIMNGILASQNLPAALDDATNQEALPESIRQKSSKVKALGGIDAVTSMIADLPNLYKRNQEILDETLRLLNEEKESDDRLRAQFKEKWTRMGSERLTAPLHQEVGKYRGILQAATNADLIEKWTRMGSERLTAPLHQEVGKYRGILQAATNADQIVKQKMEENREAIKLLSLAEPELRPLLLVFMFMDMVGSQNELEMLEEEFKLNQRHYCRAAIPGLDPKAANKNSEAVQKLRALMDTVQEIKVEREQLEKEFADVHCDMTSAFLKAMADSQILNEEQLSTAKINEIYGPLREKVSESIKKQESCLAEVELWNKKFCAEKAGSSGAAERERILKMLANGHDKYVEIKSNLQEGTKFYNDLTPLLVRLQQKVSDFCFARQTEKEDLMKQLQQNIVSGLEACAAVAAKKVQRHLDEIASKVNISGLMEGSSSSSSSAPPRPPPPKVSQSSSNPFDVVDEAPIPPPRNVNALHATNEPSKASAPNAPVTQAPPAYQPQQYNPQFGQPQQQQQFPSYAQPMPTQPMPGQPVPFMYTPQVPYMQPQFNQNYTTPYPIAYPGTYPGAFNPHGYGQFPPQPQHPQWGNPPTSQ